MTFGKSGRLYIVTRHNGFLAVELVRMFSAKEPIVKTLPPINGFGNKLSPARVLTEVLKGVAEANEVF